ncbi:uncharacterized protein LOC143197547 [Rhynchophorus ferrugineus]|uniref:uncharacterized protein LOC143197547 n=1 Tax=Rhynchophorus ferrugineus TaxID=354439 RepID=UPI003FCDBC64
MLILTVIVACYTICIGCGCFCDGGLTVNFNLIAVIAAVGHGEGLMADKLLVHLTACIPCDGGLAADIHENVVTATVVRSGDLAVDVHRNVACDGHRLVGHLALAVWL